MRKVLIGNLIIGFSIILISGCGPKRPLVEIIDVQEAIQKAREAGAEKYAPQRLTSAQDYLIRAQELPGKREAKKLVQEAQVDARIAEFVAKREVGQAKEQEVEKEKETKRRKKLAYQRGEKAIAKAQRVINKAEKENKEIEEAKDRLREAKEALVAEMFEEAKMLAQKAEELVLKAKLRLPGYYRVEKGETLRIIARKLYGNPEKWALIYKANKNEIKNADTIYPGQRLVIPREE